MYVCMYVSTYVRTYVRMHVCMYVGMHACMHMHVCMYVCMYVCCLNLTNKCGGFSLVACNRFDRFTTRIHRAECLLFLGHLLTVEL